jgi:hypothetical protein
VFILGTLAHNCTEMTPLKLCPFVTVPPPRLTVAQRMQPREPAAVELVGVELLKLADALLQLLRDGKRRDVLS